MALLEFHRAGMYCPQADIFVDPWHKVDRALITHGHADHARWGHKYYLCTHSAKPVMQHRLGKDMYIESVGFGEKKHIHGVEFSFHPAGHILGAAQIRVAYKGEVWVVSGDYKVEADGLAEPFEPVPCHTFITESTFGLPVYRWKPDTEIFQEIDQWWKANQDAGKVSILCGYSLGKAQRLIQGLNPETGPVFTHGAVENINEVMRAQGVKLLPTRRVHAGLTKKELAGGMVVAPPSVLGSAWLRQFAPYTEAIASGWMALRGARRRRAVQRGFILSDHADWTGLNRAIRETGAQRVGVTHGYTHVFARWLRDQGLDAFEVDTQFEGELGEINESSQKEADNS